MFLIDDPNAVPIQPTTPAAATEGWFVGGNPVLGVRPTPVRFWWLNMIQAELAAILSAAGVVRSKLNNAQVLAALYILFARRTDWTNGTNSHGSYRISPDGTIDQWGEVVQPLDGTGYDNIGITLPMPFPSGQPPTLVLVTTANTTATANGGSYSAKTASGFVVALNAPLSFTWFARGR